MRALILTNSMQNLIAPARIKYRESTTPSGMPLARHRNNSQPRIPNAKVS
jgi:hypothetical protein